MALSLTKGAINTIVNTNPVPVDLKPILQVLSIKAIASPNQQNNLSSSQRYRFVLYDGQEQVTAMLATQLNSIVVNNEVNENSLVRLDEYAKSTISNSAVVIILRLTVVGQASDNRGPSSNPITQQQQQQQQQQQPNHQGGGVGPSNPYGAPLGNNAGNAYGGANSNNYNNNNNNNNNNNPTFNKPQAALPGFNNNSGSGGGGVNANIVNPYQQQNAAPQRPTQQPQQQQFQQQQQPFQQQFQQQPFQQQPFQQQQHHMGSVPTPTPYGSNAANYKPISRYQDGSGGGDQVTPISALSPYSNKWTIKARVIAKADVKAWSKPNSEGKFFSVDLLDADSTTIRAMFWKDSCDKFFALLEEGKVYTFSGGKIKQANPKFSTIKNDYELDFGVNADVRPSIDDNKIKSVLQTCNFIKVRDLINAPVDQIIDVIGLVRSVSDVQEIQVKSQGGKTTLKRDVIIVDDTMSDVKVTLWGDKASFQHQWNDTPIVSFKGVKVGDYAGRSLATVASSVVSINPDCPEAFALYSWKISFPNSEIPATDSLTNAGGAGGAGGAKDFDIERRKPISSIRDDSLGIGSEKGDYLTISGYIQFIRKDSVNGAGCWYPACQTCNKKAIQDMSGNWSCESCAKSFDSPIRRYIISLQMQDYSGNGWFSVFDDGGQKIFGVTADYLDQLKSGGNDAELERVYNTPLFQTFTAKVKVKQEMVNDEPRLKNQIVQIMPVDYVQQNRDLLRAISKYY